MEHLSTFFNTHKITVKEKNPDGSYIIVIDNYASIFIYNTDTPKDIVNKINRQRENINNAVMYGECTICREIMKVNENFIILSCPTCVNHCCVCCYLQIFFNGSGIVKCPFCNQTSGYIMDLDEQMNYSEELLRELDII